MKFKLPFFWYDSDVSKSLSVSLSIVLIGFIVGIVALIFIYPFWTLGTAFVCATIHVLWASFHPPEK